MLKTFKKNFKQEVFDLLDFTDFKNFVQQFDYNIHTRMALPLLIAQKIHGIQFALACDVLKELSFINYAKPDVHLIDVLTKTGICEKHPINVFEAVTKMAKDCKDIDTKVTLDAQCTQEYAIPAGFESAKVMLWESLSKCVPLAKALN